MWTLLSMVCVLFKPCWLTQITCTCFKATALLLNVHWRCFVDFILCLTEQYMFKGNNKRIRLICWMCSKLKIKAVWHRSDVFIVDFDHSQHINIVFILLTLNKYLSVGCERKSYEQVFVSRVWKKVIMFWKDKKLYICFVTNVTRPI